MERVYTIPLRDAWKSARTRRAKRAITIIREFLIKHMKCENVKIGSSINKAVWARGIQKPPRKVKIHTLKSENVVYAELIGVEIKLPTKEEIKKKEERKAEKERKRKEERKERKEKPPELEAEKERKEKVKKRQ